MSVEEQAYYAHPDGDESEDAYVCWECASEDERADQVPSNDAVGERCARCGAWWEWYDA